MPASNLVLEGTVASLRHFSAPHMYSPDCKFFGESVRPHMTLASRGAFQKSIGADQYVLRTTNALFIPDDIEFRVTENTEGGHDYTVIEADAGFWSELAAQSEKRLVTREFRHDLAFHRLHLGVLSFLRKNHGDALDRQEIVIDLAARAVAASGAVAVTPLQMQRGRRVEAALIERHSENIGVVELAKIADWSPFHLARTFRRATGQSLREFRLKLRLSMALERLAQGTDDLTALALELGFSNHAHLAAAFRRVLNASPSELREEFREPDVERLRAQLRH